MTDSVAIPETIPNSCRSAFARLLSVAELADPAHVAKELDAYVRFLREEAVWRPHLQQNFIADIDTVGRALLHELHTFPRPHQFLVVAALLYFIEPTDANDDIDDPLGLDDDLAVINAILLEIGWGDRAIVR